MVTPRPQFAGVMNITEMIRGSAMAASGPEAAAPTAPVEDGATAGTAFQDTLAALAPPAADPENAANAKGDAEAGVLAAVPAEVAADPPPAQRQTADGVPPERGRLLDIAQVTPKPRATPATEAQPSPTVVPAQSSMPTVTPDYKPTAEGATQPVPSRSEGPNQAPAQSVRAQAQSQAQATQLAPSPGSGAQAMPADPGQRSPTIAADARAAAAETPLAAAESRTTGHTPTTTVTQGETALAASAKPNPAAAPQAFGLVEAAPETALADKIAPAAGLDAPASTRSLAASPQMPAQSAAQTHAGAILGQVQQAMRSDGGEIMLRLDPPELGVVRISMSIVDGALTAQVAADRSEVLELLRRHGDQLSDALSDAGYAGADIHFGDKQSDHTDEETAANGRDVWISAGDPQTAPSVSQRNNTPHWTDGGLDLRL